MRDQAQKTAILEAAFEKFRRFGIRRVTMDEIARDLRISKKTLYQHFPDKETLVRACTDRVSGELVPAAKKALASRGTVVERMLGSFGVFSSLPRLISAEFVADLKSDYPHLWNEIDGRRHEILARFEKLIEQGVASGEIRPGIHPKAAMRMMFAVVENVVVPDVLALGEFTPSEAVSTLVTIFSKGMFAKVPR
ncbi:MAG: TetR/AcrR family transcriptional regulator [Deltaproteobacteria bacterium]|nr:TetR/AcrR family transcriptional regulator [Deltaproteobacteria bacterium]